MTETAVKQDMRLVVVSETYPVNMQPNTTAPGTKHACWTSENLDDRTFFALNDENGMPFLVVPREGDERSAGMRTPFRHEQGLIEACGLDPDDFRAWSIASDYVQEKPKFEVGEQVRVVRALYASGHEGQVGTLASIEGEGQTRTYDGVYHPYVVNLSGGTSLYVAEIVKVEPEPEPEPIKMGDRVRVVGYAHMFDGRVGEVVHLGDGGRSVNVRFDSPQPEGIDRPPLEVGGFAVQYVERLESEPKPDLTLMTVEESDLRDKVTALEAEVAEARAEMRAALDAKRMVEDQYDQDIATIGDRLIDECQNRGWCEVFDEVIHDLNSGLHKPLREQETEKEYEVSVTVTYDIVIDVTATSEAEARNKINEGDYDRILRSRVADNSYDEISITEVDEV